MGKKKKEKKAIELKNEQIVNLIKFSDKSFNTIAKENNISIEILQSLIDEYDKSLELKLEEDKKERKEIKELFLEIEKGLLDLEKEAKDCELPDRNYNKVYAKVFDGEKWI